jgi:hypothetical protein
MILLISEISIHRTKFGARCADRSGAGLTRYD